MMETQDAQVRSEGIPSTSRAEGKPMKETLRKHGPIIALTAAIIALATALLASYALVLNSISDLRADFRVGMTELRADFRAEMTDLRQDFRAEFEKVDARFERVDARIDRVDARLYELNERVARIEGHLGLTEAPAAETSAVPIPSPASEQASLPPGV